MMEFCSLVSYAKTILFLLITKLINIILVLNKGWLIRLNWLLEIVLKRESIFILSILLRNDKIYNLKMIS